VIQAAWLALVLFGSALSADEPKNIVKSITTVDGQVEIKLTSDDPFIPRNELIKLGVGDQEFTRSRSPKGGSANTIIFMMSPEAFAQLSNGAELVVYYGQKDSSKLWRFGAMDKSLLDKQGRANDE